MSASDQWRRCGCTDPYHGKEGCRGDVPPEAIMDPAVCLACIFGCLP